MSLLSAVRLPVLATSLVLLLAACATPPAAPQSTQLRQKVRLLVAEAPVGGQWPEGRWWTVYQDPDLNQLVELALANAPSLGAADARFATAVEAVRVTGAALGLQVESSASLSRQRLSDNGLFPHQYLGFSAYNMADLGVSARYSFDWWGKQRAGIAAVIDESRATDAERQAAGLQITAAVVEMYFGWQHEQQRLLLLQQRQVVLQRQAALTQQRIAAQLDNGDAAHRIAQEQAVVQEQVAALQGAAQLRRVAMAALLGGVELEIKNPPVKPLPTVDLQLPASASLDLIAHRPDVAASRWRVEALQQDLVGARADYYPDVSLRALVGLESIELGKLLRAGSAVPSVGAAIHLPLFDGGLRDARFAARQAQLRTAVAEYDSAVFMAAREVGVAVSNGLTAAMQVQQRNQQMLQLQALSAAADARLQAGLTDQRSLLSLQLEQLASRDALVQLQFAALTADIALQRALGGGYHAMEDKP
jgi:multidrug efflux system outer membrane protein